MEEKIHHDRAEKKLRRSETLLNAAQRIAKIGGWEWDLVRQEMYWTEETYRIHDLDPGYLREGKGEHIERSAACYPGQERDRVLKAFRKCVDEGKPYSMVCRFVTAKGRKLWIRTSGEAIFEGGRIVKVIGHIQDITEQKQLADERLTQARLLSDMGQIAEIGGWEFNVDTGEGTWTDEVARIHDLPEDADTSREIGLNFYRGESRARIETAIREAVEHQKPYDLELELVTAKDARKWVRTIGRPVIKNGKVVQLRGAIQDITRHKLFDQQIAYLNRILIAVRDVGKVIMEARDAESLIRECVHQMVKNGTFAMAMIILTAETDRPYLWAREGDMCFSEGIEKIMKDGDLPPCCKITDHGARVILVDDRPVICSKCPVSDRMSEHNSLCVKLVHEQTAFGYLLTAQSSHSAFIDDEGLGLFVQMAGDLALSLKILKMNEEKQEAESRKKQLEKQLFQAQKMESIGNLAGGVAHDFNNLIGVIMGYAELSLDKLGEANPLNENILQILDAAKRSSEITRQLLAFARQQTIAPRTIDLNDVVNDMLKMLTRLIGEDIRLKWHPRENLWPVHMDPSQVHQILANLCVNARDAIADVGEIVIETGMTTIDAAYCEGHAGFMPGEYVVIAVSDTGCGMEKDTLGQIFEPFFTTKKLGHGTGLGLATVYGIVRQNDGFVNVYSEPERGTVFRIYLPRYEGVVTERGEEEIRSTPPGRGETLLLVEDDTAILKMTERMLTVLGYRVISAASPTTALRMVSELGREISLIITDVVMPEMNGLELSEKLKTIIPGAKCLFMSGYPSDVIASRGVLEDGVEFIGKPFSRRDIARKVRSLLDS